MPCCWRWCSAAPRCPSRLSPSPPPTYDTWDGTSDVSWYNDTDAEFHLTTAAQLAGLSEIVNGGNTMAGKTIYLDTDLDLAGHEWTSIGQDAQGAPAFSGTFDGQNHYITNLTSRKTDYARHGLFGDISDATLKNVTLLNADVYSANGFLVEGILADWADNSTVLNCYTSGRIESAAGDKLLGGLIGQCTSASQIIGCGSDASVVSTNTGSSCDTVGGLIGQWETSADNSLISDCWFGGSIFCGYNDSGVGGILGANFDDFTGRLPGVAIKNCVVATKDITCVEPGNITWIGAAVKARFEHCFWPDSPADGGENYAAVVQLVVDWSAGTAGADPDFDEAQCGLPTDDFNSDALVAALNANAYPGVIWQMGEGHANFGWYASTVLADYTDVDAAIAEADALDRELYVDFSAVDAAKAAVVRGYDRTRQNDVNAMAQAIRGAVEALVLKGADYTAVDAAIAKADALNKDNYLDFTAVEAAISFVDRSKKITQQAEVDAMAQAIEAALDALQAKPTPAPTQEPTPAPTAAPTAAPTQAPTQQPAAPAQAASTATPAPTATPTAAPVVTATPAPAASTTIPATGDSTNIALLWVLMVVSGGVVWGIKRKKG